MAPRVLSRCVEATRLSFHFPFSSSGVPMRPTCCHYSSQLGGPPPICRRLLFASSALTASAMASSPRSLAAGKSILLHVGHPLLPWRGASGGCLPRWAWPVCGSFPIQALPEDECVPVKQVSWGLYCGTWGGPQAETRSVGGLQEKKRPGRRCTRSYVFCV